MGIDTILPLLGLVLVIWMFKHLLQRAKSARAKHLAHDTADWLRIPPLDEVQFTVYRPRAIRPDVWYPFVAFAHLAEPRTGGPPDQIHPVQRVREEAKQILGSLASEFRETSVDARQAVPSRGEITLVPQVPGLEFNPDRRTFYWLEDVHHEEFRLRASRDLDGTTARGHLSVYLGAILLAEVELAIRVGASAPSEEGVRSTGHATETGRPYRKIFASYSHKDAEIVRQYEAFIETFGDRYVRDVRDLRSGERWDPRLLELIAEADIFQLFWSSNSMRSRFVRREWEHALRLGRPTFIRPTYWEDPMPESPSEDLPPDALQSLHFHRIAINPATSAKARRLRAALPAASAAMLLLLAGLTITMYRLASPPKPGAAPDLSEIKTTESPGVERSSPSIDVRIPSTWEGLLDVLRRIIRDVDRLRQELERLQEEARSRGAEREKESELQKMTPGRELLDDFDHLERALAILEDECRTRSYPRSRELDEFLMGLIRYLSLSRARPPLSAEDLDEARRQVKRFKMEFDMLRPRLPVDTDPPAKSLRKAPEN